MIRLALVFWISMVSLGRTYCQDYSWWNNLVQWDQKTPWQGYLMLSAGGLGPNALPVPEFNNEISSNTWTLRNQWRYHFNKGDGTADMFTRLDYTFSERFSIAMWMVPLEYYNTSIEIRNERRIREFNPKGLTTGDFYFGTYFKLFEEGIFKPDVIVSANIKTASGNNIEGGRVSDTPGYYFDVLLAKTISSFRPYVATGLYVYQTYDSLHAQNDAIMYALGMTKKWLRYHLNIEWAGYWGYLDIGDRPSIIRSNFQSQYVGILNWNLGLQVGINDFDYTTLSLGIIYSKK